MSDASNPASVQQKKTTFEKGRSGNPKGRPRGSRNRITAMAEKLVEGDAADIVKACIRSAIEGDPTATKLMIERIYPLRRGCPVVFDLPPITGAADIPAAMASVIAAVSSGGLSPEEGAAVATIVEAGRRAIETSDIERRIAEMEHQADG